MITYYAEYDPLTGKILSCGHCNLDLFPPKYPNCGVFIKTENPIDFNSSFYNLETKQFENKPEGDRIKLDDLRRFIGDDLSRTDYTQAIDAPDHMDATTILAWKDYRSNLRAAYNLETVDVILAALPASDPKGLDFYKQFR